MNHEILERLLIDRALGQLTEDVEALLAEHLSSSSQAGKMAEDIEMTVSLAAKALPPSRIAAPAQFPISNLLREEHFRRRLALAASFILGAGVAFLGLKAATLRSDHAATPPAVAQSVNAVPAPQPSAEVEREAQFLPFWSNRRAILLATAARRQPENQKNP
jgi:hypothetical protein